MKRQKSCEISSRSTLRSVENDLETTFVRLYTDFKGGALNQTFERAGLVAGDTQSGLLEAALASASEKLTLPAAVLRRTPNISAHKQQRLYDRLNAKIALVHRLSQKVQSAS